MIEEFTGAHTRIVWTEHQRQNEADTFADGQELLLKGIDTRDGKGERMIQDRLDNYSRPIISTDGSKIIFSSKKIEGPKGQRRFVSHVYWTDWKGRKPQRLTEGYASDSWQDGRTGTEWIYVARGFQGGKRPTLDADQIVRVKLDNPSIEETVYVDGQISPDNLQLSRDGSMASGVFPWPNCGVLSRQEDGTYHAHKLLTGCWPSLAPDNSGVSWVFNGAHRGAVFFTRNPTRMWEVDFSRGAGMDGYELYHPRWSNHARFLSITGPYVAGKAPKGNMIREGGAAAQVYIGKFSEKLDRIEGWLQVTHDTLSESYPDLWIASGPQYDLAAFVMDRRQAEPSSESDQQSWPVVRDGLLFLWTDRNATNHFKGRDGKIHDSATVEARGSARFGRWNEMLPGNGWFEAVERAVAFSSNAMRTLPDVTVEMALLPASSNSDAGVVQHLFRGPGLGVWIDNLGRLNCRTDGRSFRSESIVPAKQNHVAAVRRRGVCELYLNGTAIPLQDGPAPSGEFQEPASSAIRFGGGWTGGLMGVAIHDRALRPDEIAAQAQSQMTILASLSPAAPQVQVSAKLVEVSPMPTAEGIAPYRSALVAYVYEVTDVRAGAMQASKILVKHWAMLDQRPVRGFPREVGTTYDLILEPESEHLHLKGERVVDDTTSFDLRSWVDTAQPELEL